jgi:probable HAF family extracellular repeat protein
LAAIFAVDAASASVAYTVVDLGPGEAYGISGNGQVVGYGSYLGGNGGPFLYSNGAVSYLGGSGYAYGVNNSGQVVGESGQSAAFLYSNGTTTYIGGSAACAINNAGQIVGTNGLYTGGAWTRLQGVGYAINDQGQVAGGISQTGNAFLYNNSKTTVLGAGVALGINDSLEVVGVNGANDACLWTNGVMTDLGFPGVAYGINNLGQVVGSFGYGGGGAFLYSGGVTTYLNSLIDPGSGWTLLSACAINDNGQIVGWGINTNSGYSGEEAFLLNPVPEPGTAALFGLALAGVGYVRKVGG